MSYIYLGWLLFLVLFIDRGNGNSRLLCSRAKDEVRVWDLSHGTCLCHFKCGISQLLGLPGGQ